MNRTAARRTKISYLLDTDPIVKSYASEGSFGYLHHEARTAAADELLQLLAWALDYTTAEFAGLLISKMGRWAGDYLPAAGKPITARHEEQLRTFLADRRTRSFAAGSYHGEKAS